MIRKSGFTLVEILVVVVLLGILAAVIVPQFSEAGTEARTSALATDLRRVRSQIEFYKFQHNEQLPAATGETSADFVTRMTTQTDADGNAGADFGPYMQLIPVNPCNDLTTVRIDGLAAGAGADGWRFDTSTGTFQADDSAAHAAL
ncbi:MAG: prepilin-type N-terminal cleavage/methylation domain-containing protein [Planctomycetota bacterium]|nr:prepilin-type N-terminal cleavage/methylation domain-containing protein [Planctomycetota bacterium]